MEQKEKDWNERYLTKDIPWEEDQPSYELGSLLKTYCNEKSKIYDIGV